MPTRAAPCIAVTVAVCAALAGGAEREWADVQLAWRGDPRATADAPFEAEAAPVRRPSRRAQRRATVRRRMPLDTIPVEVRSPALPPETALDAPDGFATGAPDPPLRVGATLDSPFASGPAGPPGAVLATGRTQLAPQRRLPDLMRRIEHRLAALPRLEQIVPEQLVIVEACRHASSKPESHPVVTIAQVAGQ